MVYFWYFLSIVFWLIFALSLRDLFVAEKKWLSFIFVVVFSFLGVWSWPSGNSQTKLTATSAQNLENKQQLEASSGVKYKEFSKISLDSPSQADLDAVNIVLSELLQKENRTPEEVDQIEKALKIKSEIMKKLAVSTLKSGQEKVVADKYSDYVLALDKCNLDVGCINQVEKDKRENPKVLDPNAIAEGFKTKDSPVKSKTEEKPSDTVPKKLQKNEK